MADFPMFELVGPPCEHPGCKGVLVDNLDLKTKDFFRRCSVCKREFHRMPAVDKLAWVKRVIERAFDGGQSN